MRKQKKNDELRLILVGKTGAGKSGAGNTILGREEFQSELSSSSWTFQCKSADGEVRGRKVVVVDTPGLFDTNFTEEEVLKKIKSCMSLSAPGPHAFLLVLRLGRFTKEEKETLRVIQRTFGEEAVKYSLVLFTHGDKLKKQTIEGFISKSEDLRDLIDLCNGRYHVFNNVVSEPRQTEELLEKVERMVQENGGGYYTKKMLKRAEKASKKEKKMLLKVQKAEEKLRKDELRAEVEKEMGGTSRHRTAKGGKCVLQ